MGNFVLVSVGDIYNSWTVLDVHETSPITLTCKCVCGTVKTTLKSNVIGNKSKGCKECSTKKARVHAGRGTRLHNIWQGMVQRCTSTSENKTKNYKQLGITLCKEWHDFLVFKEWAISTKYSDTLSLDRVNTYKGYYPENCRWATRAAQSSNRRRMSNNTSGFVGVSEIKPAPHLKWKAYIHVAGKHINLGRFSTPEEASMRRDAYINSNNLDKYPTEAQRNEL